MNGMAADLGCDTTIKVGDRVKAYDFPDNHAERRELCYKIGTVEAIETHDSCPRYKVKVESGMFSGEVNNHLPEYIIPPVNGTPTWAGRVCNGVVKI